MMREAEHVPVKIGAVSLEVPLCGDQDLTAEIAQEVEKKLDEIEAEGGRVNTLHFAVRAAYEFAAELHVLREEFLEETHDYDKALEHIASQLKAMHQRFHLAPLPDEEDGPLEA